jgi:DNA-binding transcriptional regulator YhcF (GntR family)
MLKKVINKGATILKLVTAPPKSQQVADFIREQIKTGKIKAGQRLESVRTLAEKFSVGRQVVLSAFETLAAEGLVFSQVGRGTFVSGRSIGVVSSKNYRIGFFVNKSRVETFYNRNVFLGASEKAGEAGVTLLLAPDDEFELTAWIEKKQLDGLIVTGRVDLNLMDKLKKLRMPFVTIGNYDLPEDINKVETPEELIISVIMRQAHDRYGFKSAGAILGPADLRSSKKIVSAMKESMRYYPVDCSDENFVFSDMEEGYFQAEQMFAKVDAPEIVFVTGQAFPGFARYIFERAGDEDFKRPVVITAMTDKYNIMYPELIDIVIYGSAREMGNLVVEILDNKSTNIQYRTQNSEFEFLR